MKPHRTVDEIGVPVEEYWNGERKLTIYRDAPYATFIKSWGPHVLNEMVDGVILTDADEPELMRWIEAVGE